jgi:hypothetical protein
MKLYIFSIFIIWFILILISESQIKNNVVSKLIDTKGSTIASRFKTPENYCRIKTEANSFSSYLRNLSLKPFGSFVLYYNHTQKIKENVYISVVNMDIDCKDLQQCADAVIRLRAEYFFAKKDYNKIHFNLVSDSKPKYYLDYVKGDYSYPKFRKYLNYIFSYANTSSLCDELIPVHIDSMRIGDVFVQKGKPYGHAVIVVDMAVELKTGKKIYILAQSYMPAQETQILINQNNDGISPWYELDYKQIITPEWTFNSTDLRRFNE